MRISPLGIWGVNYSLEDTATWAMQDAALTHPHLVCQQVNALFAMALAYAIKNNVSPREVYLQIERWAEHMTVQPEIMQVIRTASESPPSDYTQLQGWVLLAFQNALWQLVHAPSFEEGVVDTVMRGGDTDTTAAICGALLGAVYGIQSIPKQWVDCVLNCRPKSGLPGVRQPRPEYYWPVDALELAEQLITPQHSRQVKCSRKKPRETMTTFHTVVGDITQCHHDAIVNSAHPTLQHGGGVCGAIHTVAGEKLEKECLEKYGKCEVGHSVITAAYSLPCKYVIHTVCPRYRDVTRLPPSEEEKEKLLYQSYQSALHVAVEHGIRSIAFPCMGIGIFAWPVELAADIAAKAILDFTTSNPCFELIEIYCANEEIRKVYAQALAQNGCK